MKKYLVQRYNNYLNRKYSILEYSILEYIFASKTIMINKSIHNEEYKTVIRLLRNIRAEKGITQGQLAESLGCSQTVISKIETSERRLDIIELRKICLSLNISFIDFILLAERSLVNDRS